MAPDRDTADPVVGLEEVEIHLAAVKARQAEPMGELERRVAVVADRLPVEARRRLFTLVSSAQTEAKRLIWLRRIGDAMSAASAGVSACRRGCSACCHIAVTISEHEARLIGKELGRQPADVAENESVTMPALDAADAEIEAQQAKQTALTQALYGQRCQFLVDGECSIYDIRPVACRQLVNMDVDALLCRIVPGHPVLVPHLDSTTERHAYILAMGAGTRYAALSAWFPPAAG